MTKAVDLNRHVGDHAYYSADVQVGRIALCSAVRPDADVFVVFKVECVGKFTNRHVPRVCDKQSVSQRIACKDWVRPI